MEKRPDRTMKSGGEESKRQMTHSGSEGCEKQKGKYAQADKAEERPVDDPMRLELRIGLVTKVWRHPEADKWVAQPLTLNLVPFGVPPP